MRVTLKRGLDVQIGIPPGRAISPRVDARRSALLLNDYRDLRASLTVAVGDRVSVGQRLCVDRKHPGVAYTSFCSGVVREIERAAKRRVQSVVVERDGSEDTETFPHFSSSAAAHLSRSELRDLLLRSGAWTSFRSRPFDRVASPDIEPRAIFVTAIDTNPLAPDPSVVLSDQIESFSVGLRAVAKLTTGTTYVCIAPGAAIPTADGDRLRTIEFAGPHPAGLPGTHIHAVGVDVRLPADLWHIGYQDVAAIGALLLTGKVAPERIVSLIGPDATDARLMRINLGDEIRERAHRPDDAQYRVISGSPLFGTGDARFLGRYDRQITRLPNVVGAPIGARSIYSRLLNIIRGPRSGAVVDTAMNGWPSGMLPVEAFDRVWPFRTAPAALLRALLAEDVSTAERLGCLGLTEEDLALCAYVCPAKRDYATALRTVLQSIEQLG
jgi:Na+-transporting NADH:ubiquinone oxidoreductase subunit A